MDTLDNNVTELGYPAIHTQLEQTLFGYEREPLTRLDRSRHLSTLGRFELSIPPVEPGRILPTLPPDYLTKTESEFKAYQSRLRDFVQAGFPTRPNKVELVPGWVRYSEHDGTTLVNHPTEATFIIDIETMVTCGNLPLMCAAVSNQAWYFWLNPVLANPTGSLTDFRKNGYLIPVGTNKLIVNFMVKFDSKGFDETYELFDHQNRNYFFDLMSAHIAYCGMSGKQRELYVLWEQGRANYATSWCEQTSTNSLMATWKFHYRPDVIPTIHKELRDIFVTATTLDQIRANLGTLVQYTLMDVQITSELAIALIPKYLAANPSPFTLGGHLLLNSGTLPVSPDWYQWLEGVERVHSEITLTLNSQLNKIAKDLVGDWLDGVLDPTTDPWLQHLDWEPAKTGPNKGLPAWYRKARAKSKGVTKNISMRSQLAPLLLRIEWKGSPVRYFRKFGWCYTPSKDSIDEPEFWVGPDGTISNKPLPGHTPYDRIPHPGGDANNCGNPLGKDYIKELDEGGFLSSSHPNAKTLLETASSITYWDSARERVFEQKPKPYRDLPEWWGIDPQLLAHGTSSRRCVEALWLTTCQSKYKRVGSEVLSKVQAPPGYRLVGCDFDTQEVKIASLEGEAMDGSIVGSTAMGWMVINGNQKDGTDPHSMVAKPFGVSRQIGKIINFSAIFLCGAKKMASSIKAKNPTWSEEYCLRLATKALERKRGIKGSDGLYQGGTDSLSFNFMLTYGNTKPLPYPLRHLNPTDYRPRTPLLRSAMSEAINIKWAAKDFLTTRANWCVQSTGVDLLHMTLCIVHHLATQSSIKHRFVLARHDEVWFLVPDDQTLEFAKVLQIASVTVWSQLAKALGFKTLPENYAWFSGINVDYCIRKEPIPDYSTKTVSNPTELPYGYVLTPSEVWPKC